MSGKPLYVLMYSSTHALTEKPASYSNGRGGTINATYAINVTGKSPKVINRLKSEYSNAHPDAKVVSESAYPLEEQRKTTVPPDYFLQKYGRA